MDRTVPVDALLEHAAFVRSLARHLLRDPADEDDAVQETWRASLESPPREGGSVRAWLGQVLRNVVRQDARGRGRRHARESRAARPEGIEPVHATVARQELVQHVANAVASLDEPYRRTILLRYYEGLPPRAIAVRMDVPVETVKSRLKRGRARLRAALDRRAVDWRTALLPIAGLTSTAATATTAASLGALAMSTHAKVLVAAALLVLLGTGAWFVLDDPDDPPILVGEDTTHDDLEDASAAEDDAPALRTSGATPTSGGAVPGGQPPASGGPTPKAKDETKPAAAQKGTGRIQGHVLVEAGQTLRGSATITSMGKPATTPIAADGSFRFRGLLQGTHVVRVDVEGKSSRTLTVNVRGEQAAIIVEFGSARVWGIAYDELGRPREGASVRISTHLVETPEGWRTSAGATLFRAETHTGPDGRYAFDDLPKGTYTIVGRLTNDETHSARNIRSFNVTLAADEVRRLDLGEQYEDPTWAGVVRYDDGSIATGGGNIFLESEDGERRMYVRYDDEGRFSEQVPVGTYRMEFVLSIRGSRTPRMRLVQTAQRLHMGDHGSSDDAIIPGTRLAGRVEGKPLPAGQSIRLVRTTPDPDAPSSIISSATNRPIAIPVQGDGRFAVVGLRPGTYRVEGHPKALAGSVEVEITPGQAEADLQVRTAK